MSLIKKRKYDIKYLQVASIFSSLSTSNRNSSGAILIKDGVVIADGYNGPPDCMESERDDTKDNSNQYIIHAEINSILKVARSNQSCAGATIYLTSMPCLECAKFILQAGIIRIVYIDKSIDSTVIDFLKCTNIECEQIDVNIYDRGW